MSTKEQSTIKSRIKLVKRRKDVELEQREAVNLNRAESLRQGILACLEEVEEMRQQLLCEE